MRTFRHRRHRMPELNTASLPDMIFTVLFFFMIVTTMRETEMKVRYVTPQSDDVEKLAKRQTITHIYIGMPTDAAPDEEGEVRIQFNDAIVDVSDIGRVVTAERSRMSDEDAQEMKVSIRADKNVPMGIISDVKDELRRAGALDIVYSVDNKDKRPIDAGGRLPAGAR